MSTGHVLLEHFMQSHLSVWTYLCTQDYECKSVFSTTHPVWYAGGSSFSLEPKIWSSHSGSRTPQSFHAQFHKQIFTQNRNFFLHFTPHFLHWSWKIILGLHSHNSTYEHYMKIDNEKVRTHPSRRFSLMRFLLTGTAVQCVSCKRWAAN